MTVTLASVAQQYGINIAELRALNPGVSDTQQFNSITEIKMPADWYQKHGYNMTDQLHLSDQQVEERSEATPQQKVQAYRDGCKAAMAECEKEKQAAWDNFKSFHWGDALYHFGKALFLAPSANQGQIFTEQDKKAQETAKLNAKNEKLGILQKLE